MRPPSSRSTPGAHHPGTLTLGDALGQSAPLAQLMQRARQSRERYDAVLELLPPALRSSVRPGPLDGEEWLLLVSHAAAAAKLRQLLPRLDQALREKGWQATTIKVRIQPRG